MTTEVHEYHRSTFKPCRRGEHETCHRECPGCGESCDCGCHCDGPPMDLGWLSLPGAF